jgi:hypothetical protein
VSVTIEPSVFDRDAGLVLHGRAGAVITLDFVDDAGDARDVSARTMYFEIDDVARVLAAAGDDVSQKTVTLTRTQVQAIGVGGRKAFVLIDETASPQELVWQGYVRVTGFTAQPS